MSIEDELEKIVAVEAVLASLNAPPEIAKIFRDSLEIANKERKYIRAIIAGYPKPAEGQKRSPRRMLRFAVDRLQSQHLASQRVNQSLIVSMLLRIQDLEGRLEVLEKG